MSAAAQPPSQFLTVEEYLRLEEAADEKHEYRNGEIISMAGATFDHVLIMGNLLALLHQRLAGTPCRALGSDMRVKPASSTRYYYPDVSILCGQPEFDPASRDRTITNPQVVVEITSPSTEARDRGEKFHEYLKIDALQEYVLVSQHEPRIDAFFRQPDGTWLMTPVTGIDAALRLRSLQLELPLKQIYQGVQFPPTPPAHPSSDR